jgi:hypothetical protein
MNADQRFVKAFDTLAELGVPPRLVLLYGSLVNHGRSGQGIFPKHSTLAQEIGLRSCHSRRQVVNLVSQLKALKLVKSTRRRGPSTYEILPPDVKWISHHQDVKRSSPLDVKPSSHRKEESKRGAGVPSSFGVNNNKRRDFSAAADVVADDSTERTPPRLPKGWSLEGVKRIQHAIGLTLVSGGVERVRLGPEAAIQLIRKSGGASEAEIHAAIRNRVERTSFGRAENPVGMLIHLVAQDLRFRRPEGK